MNFETDIGKVINFIKELYNKPEEFIPLHSPIFRGKEKKFLNQCIDSTFVSTIGEYVMRFEKEMAEYVKSKYAIACVNGTNALHIALLLAGTNRNEEVITQPLTFVATCNAINYCGAEPVFIDVEQETLGMSPGSLKDWLNANVEVRELNGKNNSYNIASGKRIGACVPMHVFGHPCKIDEIVKICSAYNIPVVEDAAESVGSIYKEKHCGTFGLLGVQSFNGNKIITSGGGGMILTDNEELAKRAKHITNTAKLPHNWCYKHDQIGYNYRMPNINAALGLAQLNQLSEFILRKRQIASRYKDFFNNMMFNFFTEPQNSRSNYWLNTIVFNNNTERNIFLKYSNEKNVMTRPSWELMTELPMFKNCQKGNLKNAYHLSERIVNIPSSVL